MIEQAPNLQSLALDARQCTPLTASAIARAETVLELYLYGPEVTDLTVANLNEANGLRELRLFGTSVTDATLQTIEGLPSLRSFSFDAPLSEAAIAALRRSRPDIAIAALINAGETNRMSRRREHIP